MAAHKKIDPGTKINCLTFIRDSTPKAAFNRRGLFLCDCGKTTNARLTLVLAGDTTSCPECAKTGIRAISPSRWLKLQQLIKNGVPPKAAAYQMHVANFNIRAWKKLIEKQGINAFQRNIRDISEDDFNHQMNLLKEMSHVESVQKVS